MIPAVEAQIVALGTSVLERRSSTVLEDPLTATPATNATPRLSVPKRLVVVGDSISDFLA